jgi:hypothetical protein
MFGDDDGVNLADGLAVCCELANSASVGSDRHSYEAFASAKFNPVSDHQPNSDDANTRLYNSAYVAAQVVVVSWFVATF